MERRTSPLFVLAVLTVLIACQKYKTVQVAQKRKLSEGWTDISPKQRLMWSEPVEEVAFTIDSPHSFNRDFFPVLGNGMPCRINVLIVGDDGHSYPLNNHGVLGGDMFFDTSEPLDVHSIRTIRIESGCDMDISNIVWRGYDPHDVKR